MRAAFRAVEAGKQVAVLVPTTVLAEQHYRTFSARMAEFPFTIEAIHRFRTRGEIRETLEKTTQGSGRHPDRHAPAGAEGRGVQGPGAGDHRRGAAVRRRGQGVAEAPAGAGGRADAIGDAHSADACT